MSSAAAHTTRWSLVQAAKVHTPQGRAALAELCEVYYSPVESLMRRWVADSDEAREITQAFFAQLLAGDGLNGADAERGRFRSYLFSAARHFLYSLRRAQRAEKRGADLIDAAGAELLHDLPDESQAGPDVEFDRAWTCALIARGLQALEAELSAAGKASAWEVLKPWLAGTASHGDTAQAAARLGISETAVRVQLSRLRQRLRGHLEQQIADTLAPGVDLQAELRHLLGLWG